MPQSPEKNKPVLVKKKYFLALIVVTILGTQNMLAQKRIDIGIKGGLSIPNLTTGSTANPVNSGYGSRLGADFAMHAEFHLSKHFSFQPQLQYSQQGGRKDGNQAFVVPPGMAAMFPPGEVPPYLYADYKSVARINYLMLSTLAKYRLPLGRSFTGYVAAGPFVSIVLSAKNISSGSSIIYLDAQQTTPLVPTPQSVDNTENIKSDLRPVNAGINGHAGISYQLRMGAVFIEGGGNYGLITIQQNEANGKNNTGAATVSLGYQFMLR